MNSILFGGSIRCCKFNLPFAYFFALGLELLALKEDDEGGLGLKCSLLYSYHKFELYSVRQNKKFDKNTQQSVRQTVCGSSMSSSMSAVRKNTLPRQKRHNINSNGVNLSRWITPARHLDESEKLHEKILVGDVELSFS